MQEDWEEGCPNLQLGHRSGSMQSLWRRRGEPRQSLLSATANLRDLNILHPSPTDTYQALDEIIGLPLNMVSSEQGKAHIPIQTLPAGSTTVMGRWPFRG